MWALLKAGIAALLAPRIVSKLEEYFDDTVDYFTEEPVKRKVYDTHKITQQQKEYICDYCTHNKCTGKEYTAHFNKEFGFNKSINSYSRIWKERCHSELNSK